MQPTAISGESAGPIDRKNKRNPLRPAATGCLRRSMVSRASAVGCHPLREVPSLRGRRSTSLKRQVLRTRRPRGLDRVTLTRPDGWRQPLTSGAEVTVRAPRRTTTLTALRGRKREAGDDLFVPVKSYELEKERFLPRDDRPHRLGDERNMEADCTERGGCRLGVHRSSLPLPRTRCDGAGPEP